MNANGKKARAAMGGNRFTVRRATHTHKSAEKCKRAGWVRSKKKNTKNNEA
jgi:hypothetical protein